MFSLRIRGGALLVLALFVLMVFCGPVAALLVAMALMAVAIFRMAPRPHWLRAALPVLLLALVLLPAASRAATIEVGQSITSGVVDAIGGIVAALISTGLGWLFMLLRSKFNIDIEAKHREALTQFLQRAASSLVSRGAVQVQGLQVQVGSDALANVANMALHAVPDAMKFFGLTPDKLEQRIRDLLPQQPAVAQAQAVALDTANRATPSQPALQPAA